MASRKKPAKTKEAGPSGGGGRPAVKPFRFGFLVHDVSRMRRTLFDTVMRTRGVTRSQWSLLANLSRVAREDGMTQVDLARMMDMGKVTIGGLIDRLEAGGIVERRLDAQDRRARRIFITDKGFDVIAEMEKAGAKLNKSILAGVSPEDLHITEETLAKVKSNIRQMLSDD